MRITITTAMLVSLAACTGGTADTDNTGHGADTARMADPSAANNATPADTGATASLVPLTSSGIRFNGVYHYAEGKLQYYMRFFERGSAAFIVGTEVKPGELATLLTEDVPSGWNQVHNCPVVQRNDSLYIRSVGIKGVITYAGTVHAAGDSVVFMKVSEINGRRSLAPYGFVPDPSTK